MNAIEHFEGAEQFFAICEQLKEKRVGILGHLRPDGDCLGAQVALHEILTTYGAKAFLGLSGENVPPNLRWIVHGYELVKPEIMAIDECIFVDCGVPSRAGDGVKFLPKPLISIDHHISGERFSRNNFFYPDAAATCEIITDFLEQKAWKISKHAASALYAGILTDTGKFSYSSTTARTLFLALQLVLKGADPHQISVAIYQNEPREKFALMRHFLASLRYYAAGKICVGQLTEQDYLETHATAEDTEGFVNMLCSIAGIQIAVIAYAWEGKTRISLRCNDPRLRLDRFAVKFSGGGHRCAVGFTVDSPYEKFEKIFIPALEIHMEQNTQEHL
ncbi:MAG: bifunctional oligoribonuclease/PAP phosphatase NrnA [Puniceicoccales bacterium]|jgi:phosphoesterase RecJ-like protein|nr:bifunctional oligoribonuclease/PAP phosphatase NrnA [Puniceicoccales bacterium]